MIELSSKQRKYLRSNAHNLKPIVMVGKDGVTDGIIAEVKQSLEHHELIKIKFVEGKEERQKLSEQIATATDAQLAGTIGNVGILYREHPEAEKRRYTLP